jgi:hypothetical protein
MKTVKITMMVVVDNESPADNWIYSTISEQLERGEGIINWNYEVIEDNTAPLDDIELYNMP